jgi:CelD/BcsL family acetyltransferase involved in cellulose biosynthesis
VRLERATTLEPFQETWSSLALQTRNVFSTWEWASVWWRHFGSGRRMDVATVRDAEGKPISLLPLSRQQLPFCTVLRFIGHGPADELGPVAAPAHRSQAMAALRRLLDSERSAVFLGDRFPEGTPYGLLGARPIVTAATPVLRFETRDWNGYLASRSANLRQALRRKERRLLEAGAVFRLSDPDSLPGDLDTLLALHRERWDGRRTAFLEREGFHRDFATLASRRGWLRLWLLEVDGVAAAAWLGFRFASVEAYYQAGRARRFDGFSPGLVLLAHTVREAQADGMTEYRFLRGDETFKGRFTDLEPVVETVATARGSFATAALRLAVVARSTWRGFQGRRGSEHRR